ncbi:MAG: O-antigen ligase family protein, partial [Pirellulales bacterium]|nr:O-antigen ligase family protein [Pirellulales bacterium]
GYLRIGWISKRLAAALLGVAVLVTAALSIHGYGRLAERLGDYTTGSIESLDESHARRTIWAANIEGIRHNGMLGAGVGTHRYLHPVYLKESPPSEYTHAESGYLQLLLETGWFGLGLLVIAVAVASKWLLASLSTRPGTEEARRIYAVAVPLATGLAACVLH